MNLRITFSVLVFVAFLTNGNAQQFISNDALQFENENFRIYPSAVNQTEVFIKRSPVDDDLVFSSCNTLNFIPFFVSEGIYVSQDGGQSWLGSDSCSGEPIAYHGGDPGIVIDKNGRLILTRLGRTPFVGLYSHYSHDNGQTWSAQQVISTDDLERASLTSDAFSESAYFGRTYAVWVKFAQPFPLMFSFTDDGAQSWSTPVAINNPSTRSAGGDVAVGPDGKISVCWAGVTDVSPFKEVLVGFASSENGGADWNVNENLFPMNGITGVLANKDNIRVNGLPSIAVDTTSGPYRGRIYIVTGEKELNPAGNDPDIILHYSEDEGNSWSEAIRVNQDALNNDKTQYFPSIHIDRFGAVIILFYDDRNTSIDSTSVFLARSKDGGVTWTEYEVSDHNFKPTPIGGLGQGYQGDNIDITSTYESLLPVWMDNSTGVYQVWSTRINFEEINTRKNNFGFSKNTFESSISPNPITESADLQFHITDITEVKINILNLSGNVIFEQIYNPDKPGIQHFEVLSAFLQNKPGIYFYQICQNNKIDAGKIILLNP